MGCSNARLLVQQPLTGETAAGTTNRLSIAAAAANASTDTNNAITRMHLTGVDLVVEKNGSYTLLLTPETHKQLMPYVLRKKRFRILVDKPRNEPQFISNEQVVMENSKKKSTIEAVEQMASDEYEKTKTRIIGGRSIDRINVDNDEEYIHSDDEGMIEEIVTTVEQDKDLECKIKKKIETKKTIAQHPDTNSTITKVVKTEVTEITRTITINDHHDLERAKRELGIDDVNRLLPLSTWNEQSQTTSQIREKHYEPINEIVTSKDFPHESPLKQTVQVNEEKTILAESTSVGRGPVTETISTVTPASAEQKPVEIKKKKKKSKLCSCTRSSAEDEQEKPKPIVTSKQESSVPISSTQVQGQKLISDDLKQLIKAKKTLLIEYLHSKIFSPANLFSSNEQNIQAKQISSRILDLLSSDHCSSWSQMSEQLTQEYADNSVAEQCLKPMMNTYEKLFTTKQANLLNTFSTIHSENDIEHIQKNNDYLNIAQTHVHQTTNDVVEQKSDVIQTIEKEEKGNEQDDLVKESEEEPVTKELEMSNENQEMLPIYNEEYLVKMLGDISQHKPITLAEAIAYQYLDIEDPKLGLSNENIRQIKSLYRPFSDESVSNIIRVKRSGEYFTDINLSETNPFEKLTQQEPFVYQLQQTFEPTLDFNEKQFRSLIDALNNNKGQYDNIEFDVARTTVPIYDLKESSANDFSQSDSGYSMTTATHESLASKIKIEFEPIQQELGPISGKDEQIDEIEKIDIDKATQEQLDHYELNQDLIQAIKSDYNGTDKTVGQAILSRELRLDSNDLSDIAYLKSLGIYDEQKRILTAFFFPKQTRIIAYSPEPGRFVEAQTTFNPDYPGYKTDTTIIQIQEKQLSSDHFAKQRSIQDEPIKSSQIVETQEIKTIESVPSKKEILPTTATVTVPAKKRKSSGCGGLLSCFGSKKAKAGTEQQGRPTVVITPPTEVRETKTPVEEKPVVDLAVLPDGKRIYIDVFRDRPGMDMSYRPDDFDNRFVLPETKSTEEYDRPITSVIETDDEPLLFESNITENEVIVQSDIEPSIATTTEDEPRSTNVESVEVQSEAPPSPVSEPESTEVIIEPTFEKVESPEVTIEPMEDKTESTEVIIESVDEKIETESQLEPREPVESQTEPELKAESEQHVHLTPRSATIEPVDVQPDVVPIIVPVHKSEEKNVIKKSTTIDLHPATVNLPEIELVKPGPLPTLPTFTKHKKETKVKKSTIGLCSTCFGTKSAQKKKKSLIAEPVQAPIELEKIVIEEKQVQITPTTEIQTTTTIDKPNFSSVNIDTFRERDFLKDSEHKFVPSEVRVEHHQPPTQEPVSTISPNIPIFSNVNIDTYLDRTLMKGAEIPLKTEQRPTTTAVVSSAEESRYQAPTNQSVVTLTEPSDLSIFSQVNIDTFRERTFQKSSENLPKSTEHFETITTTTTVTTTSQESHYQSATTESTSLSQVDKPVPSSSPNDLSIFSQVNIDDFKERSFQKSSENLPKSTENIEQVNEAEIPSSPPPSPSEEPLLQSTVAPDEPVEVTTPVEESTSAPVNIDTFKERTLQKGSESRPTSPERPETTVETVQVLEESLPQSPAVATESTTEIVEVTTPIEESTSAPVNIDTFKERTLQKGSESRTTSPERPETIVETVQVLEESLPQSPAFPAESTTKIVEVTTPVEESSSAPVNIDTFKERTLQKGSESRTTSPERSEATVETVKVAEEPHYQSPTTLTESTSKPVEVSTPTDKSSSAPINIDTFKERTLQKGSEIRTTSSERSDTTVETVKVSEEPYYQSPSNKPIVTSQTTESSAKDISIYSQINIDDYRERTFEKIPKKTAKTEESPYEIPSSEPVPLISRSPIESNTYDTPRSLELQQTSTDRQIPVMTDVQKSSGDYVTSKKIQDISPIPTTETTTIAEKKKRSFISKKTKKSKEKTKKSSSLIPSLLCHKQQKPKIPALDLPAVERDISPNNPLREPHRRESDPFHVPAVELPALNFPLPNYDRPEANMTIGQIKQTDEFAVPAVNFSPIPNLQLPDENKQSIITTSNEMKVPSVDLPNIELTVIETKTVELPEIQLEKTKQEVKPTTSVIETGLALASPVDDMLSIQTDHKNFPIETDYAIKAEAIVTSITTQVIETISQTPEQQVTIIETHLVESSENEKPNLNFQLPSPEPILTISSDSKTPPSFDDDVPSPPIKIVPAVQTIEKQQIETKSELKKKSSSLRICSCFGEKSSASKEKSRPITAPKTSLPEIQMPLPSSNTSSTLKTKGPLRAPTVDLPQLNFTSESNQSTTPIPVLQQVNLSTKNDNKTVPSEPKKSSSFDIKAPSIDVPPVDLSVSTTVDAYSSREHIQSRSDSGLEQTISSPIQPSSTLADIQQLPSFSSGLGSEILDNMTVQGQSLPSITTAELKHDFTRKITLNDDIRSKLIFRENELKTRLYSEISKSIDDFDEKKDSKKLETILTDAINFIKNRHVSTYPELKQKLLAEHRNDPSLVDAVVYSLYYTIENQALDDLDKPEFPLAIRDMVRLPAKQTYDTVTHLNKESTSLTTTSMTKETLPTVSTVRSCLTCGRTKSKATLPTPSSPSLLDERHRTELNTHRNLLGNTLRDHIQSSKPPIRKFADHPKTIEKIVRKCLTLLSQPKTISYEQVRHDLKNEFKQTFYLVDPIVDITRDTFDHCDITQLNEKTNLDILDSQISQTAQIYNNQMNLLTFDEHNNFRNNHVSWLQTYLISNETTEKKLTKKQIKELTRILQRSLEILSSNTVTTWDEFNLQLQLEYPKAQDLCQRATDILRQAQRNGLFLLQNAPVQDKRRASSLITDRARQNLKTNRNQIHSLLKIFLVKYSNQTTINDDDIENILKKTLTYLEEQKPGQFKSYQDLKEQLKKDFETINQNKFIEQTVDVIEQAHATNQFDDLEKVEVQSLMRDRLDGKPLVIKEMYVSLPPRVGAYGDESGHYSSSVTNGDRTTVSYRVGRGLSWREANERARILFYRGKHPAIHYDEKSEGFDVRMVLETASGGTQEIPVTDSDVHELLNSCGVQWDGVNIISLVDHSEDVVRAAEQAALKVIREKGIVELRTPPPSASSNNDDQSST